MTPPRRSGRASTDRSRALSWAWVARATLAVLARPELWSTAARQIWIMAVPGWWHTAPFLPLPDAGYLRFRLQTAYGDPEREPSPTDLVTYLHWCRSWPRLTR